MKGGRIVPFVLEPYRAPDFNKPRFMTAPDARILPAPADGAAPANYHAMSIFPEYFRVGGRWLLAEESRMDCVPVLENGGVQIREFRNLKKGDAVICGRTENGEEGIFVHTRGFAAPEKHDETFAFRQGHSRETSFSRDYDELYELLRYERDHGNILWVAGPAVVFDHNARSAFSRLIAGGYAHGLLAGNALAAHDLEGAWLGTALGQDIYSRAHHKNGHYNHLDTINRVRECGSVERFIEEEHIADGVIRSCVANGVPYVLAGSIRDDGPLPEVYADVYAAQDAMRSIVKKATTVICMATMLHTIAVGNMTPSFRVLPDGTVRKVFFFCVDISEFMVNKLTDRGSLSSRGIVTNVQDFVMNLANGLGV